MLRNLKKQQQSTVHFAVNFSYKVTNRSFFKKYFFHLERHEKSSASLNLCHHCTSIFQITQHSSFSKMIFTILCCNMRKKWTIHCNQRENLLELINNVTYMQVMLCSNGKLLLGRTENFCLPLKTSQHNSSLCKEVWVVNRRTFNAATHWETTSGF